MTDDSDTTTGCPTNEHTDVSADTITTEPPVVLPDGGEDEAENDEETEPNEDEESADDEAENNGESRTDENEGEDEGEEDEEEEDGDEDGGDADGISEKSAQTETERDSGGEGTSLVYLDLEGLFVDLLGVEIDLNEIELDVAAVPGSGNLLGNLLSGVVGLLDDVTEALGGLAPDGDVGLDDLLPEIEIPSASDVLFGGINFVLDTLLDALGDDESEDGDEASTEDGESADEADEDGDESEEDEESDESEDDEGSD